MFSLESHNWGVYRFVSYNNNIRLYIIYIYIHIIHTTARIHIRLQSIGCNCRVYFMGTLQQPRSYWEKKSNFDLRIYQATAVIPLEAFAMFRVCCKTSYNNLFIRLSCFLAYRLLRCFNNSIITYYFDAYIVLKASHY